MIRRMKVVGLGDVPSGLLEAAASRPATIFGLETTLGVGLAEPSYAFNAARGKFHAAAILRKLARVREDGELVLGVGIFDLFDPDEDALIGDGDRDERTAVLGTASLKTLDPARTLERVSHAAVVAVGKALGLRECHDARCGMATISHPENLDRRSGKLCQSCEAAYMKGDRAWAR